MKIFNIYSIENQSTYEKEDYVMILAHLLEKGLYNPEYFKHCVHVIMDNGVYESAQVSTDINHIIKLALDSNIIVDELIIPDIMNDYEATKALYKKNYMSMFCYRDDFKFMYVTHATNFGQLKDAIDMVNKEEYLDLVLGIPKCCMLDRYSKEFIKILKTCKKPIHYLGLKSNYEELLPVVNIIRSCDSSQLLYLTRDQSVNYGRHTLLKRKQPAFDLEKDSVNQTKLELMRIAVNKELKTYGIL